MSNSYFDWADARYRERRKTVRAASHKPAGKPPAKEAAPEPAINVDRASITLSRRIRT